MSPPSRPTARPALPTLDLVGVDGFLVLGAAVGTVGWGATALLTAAPGLVPDPELLAMAVWFCLVAVMVAVGALATSDAVRFSRPLLVWGAANGTATLLSTLALAGRLPDATHLFAWPLAGLAGYAATARLATGRDARLYRTAALLEAVTLGVALVGVSPALVFALVGVCHSLTLALVVGSRTTRAPLVLVGVYLLVATVGAWGG